MSRILNHYCTPDEVIEHLPTESTFARKTKLALNPDKIPDLQWERATQLNTPNNN